MRTRNTMYLDIYIYSASGAACIRRALWYQSQAYLPTYRVLKTTYVISHKIFNVYERNTWWHIIEISLFTYITSRHRYWEYVLLWKVICAKKKIVPNLHLYLLNYTKYSISYDQLDLLVQCGSIRVDRLKSFRKFVYLSHKVIRSWPYRRTMLKSNHINRRLIISHAVLCFFFFKHSFK